MKKLLRQQKAAHKFSKERFMKVPHPNDAQLANASLPEPDPIQTLIKKNLKVDLMEVLMKMVINILFRELISKTPIKPRPG